MGQKRVSELQREARQRESDGEERAADNKEARREENSWMFGRGSWAIRQLSAEQREDRVEGECKLISSEGVKNKKAVDFSLARF